MSFFKKKSESQERISRLLDEILNRAAALLTLSPTAEMPVVFVTAFPERLLTGERMEPAFVVAKPFDPEALQVAVSQALFCARG